MFFAHHVYDIYICIPLGMPVCRGPPQCAKLDDFNTPSTHGPALSMGLGAATS